MARYVVIEFENNDAAEKLIEQLNHASKRGALYRVVGLFVKPRNICKCDGRRSTNYQRAKSGHSGVLYGRKYGWWVCTGCNRPRQAGHQLVNQLQGDTMFPDTGKEDHEMIVTNLDIYGQDRALLKRRKVKKGKK